MPTTRRATIMDQNFSSRRELYQHIRSALAHLVVFEDGEPISIGTGFAFTGGGDILTAAHVVAGGWPVKDGEVTQANRTIVAFFVGQECPPQMYRPLVCPFEVRCNGMKPMQLDLAILVPIERAAQPIGHLTASVEPPKLGDEMYFAGYSDEVEFPFMADRHILPTTEGLDTLQRALCTGVKERAAGPIVKRGTVGNVVVAEARSDAFVMRQSAFYLDNQIHSGASGGPIVATDGTVRGVISKRAVTKSGDAVVPAGSTLGIGLEPLLALSAKPEGSTA